MVYFVLLDNNFYPHTAVVAARCHFSLENKDIFVLKNGEISYGVSRLYLSSYDEISFYIVEV